jgi:hypothetical protein
MLCCGSQKNVHFSKIFGQQLVQKHVDKNIDSIRLSVQETLAKNDKGKKRVIINTIKKVIKMPIEAENKFYALTLLNDMMGSKDSFVHSYFLKKLKKRMFILATFLDDPNDIDDKATECLEE